MSHTPGPAPPTGNQCSRTLNAMISSSPSQTAGMPAPTAGTRRMRWSDTLSLCTAAHTASGTVSTTQNNPASATSSSVTPMRGVMSVRDGTP